MSYEEAKRIIKTWLYSNEPIATEWKIILQMCLDLINEKINNDRK